MKDENNIGYDYKINKLANKFSELEKKVNNNKNNIEHCASGTKVNTNELRIELLETKCIGDYKERLFERLSNLESVLKLNFDSLATFLAKNDYSEIALDLRKGLNRLNKNVDEDQSYLFKMICGKCEICKISEDGKYFSCGHGHNIPTDQACIYCEPKLNEINTLQKMESGYQIKQVMSLNIDIEQCNTCNHIQKDYEICKKCKKQPSLSNFYEPNPDIYPIKLGDIDIPSSTKKTLETLNIWKRKTKNQIINEELDKKIARITDPFNIEVNRELGKKLFNMNLSKKDDKITNIYNFIRDKRLQLKTTTPYQCGKIDLIDQIINEFFNE